MIIHQYSGDGSVRRRLGDVTLTEVEELLLELSPVEAVMGAPGRAGHAAELSSKLSCSKTVTSISFSGLFCGQECKQTDEIKLVKIN